MCGIVGQMSLGLDQLAPALHKNVEIMTGTLVHRGPDDGGTWVDASAGLALGHRRLAIVDRSPAGHQPMVSAKGRWVLSFNGEVYNHLALRAELKSLGAAPIWRGHSDTETILAGIDYWGLENTLKRCVGMFAVALWDREERTLTLARDRLGEKPLYYGWVGSASNRAFVFGSELKSLKAHPGFNATVCRQALARYLRFLYVPTPFSIYKGIFKLQPGCLLTIKNTPPTQAPAQPLLPDEIHGSLSLKRWWALDNYLSYSVSKEHAPEDELLGQLEDTLAGAVKLQMQADVPLGAFLSGGVDSSMIVALMQQQTRESGHAAVNTFTIGFDEVGFDEAPHALAVAKHLGTQHHEMRVTAQMAQDLVPSLSWMYDEPFADSSQIPTHLVSKSARQKVTVALSGDAGDELFGGYNRHLWAPRFWNAMQLVPYPLRQAMAHGLTSISPELWNTLMALGPGQGSGVTHFGEKVHKLANGILGARKMDDMYFNLVSTWNQKANLVRVSDGNTLLDMSSEMERHLSPLGLDDPSLRMMYLDMMTYLPDDILCKVDRAAMACSLETRIPFLDHRVLELALSLPMDMKIRGNVSKWALRQILDKYVPKDLIERPKAGFAIPIGQWLRGPLRDWAESLISEQRLQSDGYLNPEPVRKAWAEHISGRRDHTAKLWSVLMFQAWLEQKA